MDGQPINGARSVLSPNASSRSEIQRGAVYSAIRFDSIANFGQSPALKIEQPFEVTGDHLTCISIQGPQAIYVRLGARSNPLIPVREGMVISRAFSRIWICCFQEQSVDVERTRALFYATFGPFLAQTGWNKHGITSGAKHFAGQATAVAQRLLDTVGSALSEATLVGGGTLMVKNTDLANTLFLTFDNGVTPSFPPSGGYPLYPGESLELDLEDSVHFGLNVPNQFPLKNEGALFVGTASGTCNFAGIISRSQRDRFQNPNLSPGSVD